MTMHEQETTTESPAEPPIPVSDAPRMEHESTAVTPEPAPVADTAVPSAEAPGAEPSRTKHESSAAEVLLPETISRGCVRDGPAFRRPSSMIPRSASRRRTSWSPTWSSSSRLDSPGRGRVWRSSGLAARRRRPKTYAWP